MLRKTVLLLCGGDPKLRRPLSYWAGSVPLYLLAIAVLYLNLTMISSLRPY